MPLRIDITIHVTSDFHIGTGAGVGRTVDAVVLKDERGMPYIPASSLKGLARWHAKQLVQLYPRLDQVSAEHTGDGAESAIAEIFGVLGADPGKVFFNDARYQDRTVPAAQVHGRSARDRRSGRALEDHLFHIEDAASGELHTMIYSQQSVSWQSTLLLLMALRRIEALGAQRRRGKGRAQVTCRVIDGHPDLQGLVLPGEDASRFEAILKQALGMVPEPVVENTPADVTETPETTSSSATTPQIATDVLMVFARARTVLTLTGYPETGNIIGTLDHIAGSSLRGALAWYLLQRGWSPESEPFHTAFVREGLRVGPLYPCLPPNQWQEGASVSCPMPRSLLTCKYHPGVWHRGPHARVHGVRDVLSGHSVETCGYAHDEGTCDAPLIPTSGFLQAVAVEQNQLLRHVVLDRESIQRTQIDDRTLRGEDAMLYTTEVLPRNVWFTGYIWGPSALLNTLLASCPPELEGLRLHVGKSRTRGQGELEVFFRRPNAQQHPIYPLLLPPHHTVDSSHFDPTQHDRFTLTLYSDTIGLDSLLRPITCLTDATLWTLLGGEGQSPLAVQRGYAAVRHIAGFNGVPGLPRTPDIALVAGSTWRVTLKPNTTPDERTTVLTLIERAQRQGIGLRRGEGFGRVFVNLPLHQIDLDQPRANAPVLSIDADLAFPVPELQVYEVDGPRRPSTAIRPPIGDLPLQNVPSQSRQGLARLLLEASHLANPRERIEALRGTRERRGKERSGEDTILHMLIERCQGEDMPRIRQVLRHCAEELSRLDVATRRVRG